LVEPVKRGSDGWTDDYNGWMDIWTWHLYIMLVQVQVYPAQLSFMLCILH
jgi:hypothetical protein